MGEDVLSPAEAIIAYRDLARDERVRFSPELELVEVRWMSLMNVLTASGNAWTDAYLAAFAIEAGFRVVSFDAGMRRWTSLTLDFLA